MRGNSKEKLYNEVSLESLTPLLEEKIMLLWKIIQYNKFVRPQLEYSGTIYK